MDTVILCDYTMGSATIQHLPDEMLRELLQYVNGKDVQNFSKVSLRWQSVVDDLGEEFWRRVCRREYPDIYEDSQRKSGLSWRDLYRSFLLWDRVSEAEVRVTQYPYDNLNGSLLNFLKNCVISFPLKPSNLGNADTVVYFDTKSHREIERKYYGLKFTNYIESDDVIAFEIVERSVMNKKVRIIPKANEDMSIDFEPSCIISHPRSWFLVGDEIFYHKLGSDNDDVKFCKMKIIIKGKEVSYEDNELAASNLDRILSVKYVDGKLRVLRLFGQDMYVATIEDKQMKTIFSTPTDHVRDSYGEAHTTMEDLKRLGFSSSDPRVFWRIYNPESHCNYKLISTPLLFGSHLIAAVLYNDTKVGINVYLNMNSVQDINPRTNPDFTIDLDNSEGIKRNERIMAFLDRIRVNQIELIETIRGHIIVATYCRRLYIIDLTHNDCVAEIERD